MKKSQIKVMKMFSVIPQMKKVIFGVTIRDKYLGMKVPAPKLHATPAISRIFKVTNPQIGPSKYFVNN